jgi:hypothetical protein
MFKSMVSMELGRKNSGVKRKLIKHSMARQRKSHKLRLTCMISLLLEKSHSKSLM